MRGDHDYEYMDGDIVTGSPPLARGPLAKRPNNPPYNGITPACAGTTSRSVRNTRRHRDHPRLRGDHDEYLSAVAWDWGSPPLARGPHSIGRHGVAVRGITPACAGTTTENLVPVFDAGDHPRLRGDHTNPLFYPKHPRGSPPLARGPLNSS